MMKPCLPISTSFSTTSGLNTRPSTRSATSSRTMRSRSTSCGPSSSAYGLPRLEPYHGRVAGCSSFACRARDILQGMPCWDFEAEYVEYNENYHMEHSDPDVPKFGLARSPTLSIPIFYGTAKISSLPHYPIKYHPQVDGIKARLIERGRKWCALQGVHHKYFKGTGVDQNSVKYNVRTSIPYNTTFTNL